MSKLRKYQREGVLRIERFGGRALLADEVGLGKSIQALWWGKNFLDEWPVVIVCPAYLKGHWANEAQKHFGMNVNILEGTKPQPVQVAFLRKKAIYVVNYDILKAWLPYLLRLEPQYVILDEAHYCGNHSAQRTKFAKELSKKAPYMTALTGTPVRTSPADLWPVLNMLRPDVFNSRWAFLMRYTNPEKTPWGWQFKGSANSEELHKLLVQTCMIRRRKRDVMGELPPFNRIVIPVKLAPKDRKEYDEAMTEFLSWLEKNFGRGRASKAAKAEAVTKVGYLARLTARLKLPTVGQWAQDFLDSGLRKLILFGVSSKTVLPELFAAFRSAASLVTGATPAGKRLAIFGDFLHNPRRRVLVGNMKAAGTGWSASGVGDTAFVEFAWNPDWHTQAEGRTHGINRGVDGEPSNYYYFVAEGTIDEHLLAVNQEKQRVADGIVDGKVTEDGFDVLDRLTKRLLGGG